MNLVSNDTIVRNYLGRDVVYIAGNDDICNGDIDTTCNDSSLDTSCEGLALGWCRYARALAFYQYLELYAGRPVHLFNDECTVGHDGCGMYACKAAQNVMFGDWSGSE